VRGSKERKEDEIDQLRPAGAVSTKTSRAKKRKGTVAESIFKYWRQALETEKGL